MKMQINEFAKLAGVSVRTLHYYDEIGLLKPAFVDEQNGYRFYDEISLERMQEILFYRELDFELKSIAEILSSPDYDKQKALAEQRKLLILKKERLERIIAALDSAEKGKITMSAFDNSDYENTRKQYEAEAKKKVRRSVDVGSASISSELASKHMQAREELVRLRSHFDAFYEIASLPEPSGRKLDFLMQELNRETNTIGSKANNARIARIVVNMKGELEKIREQVQNIE